MSLHPCSGKEPVTVFVVPTHFTVFPMPMCLTAPPEIPSAHAHSWALWSTLNVWPLVNIKGYFSHNTRIETFHTPRRTSCHTCHFLYHFPQKYTHSLHFFKLIIPSAPHPPRSQRRSICFHEIVACLGFGLRIFPDFRIFSSQTDTITQYISIQRSFKHMKVADPLKKICLCAYYDKLRKITTFWSQSFTLQ